MKLYKITDKDGKTRAGCYNELQWGENVTHKVTTRGRELCSWEVIHAYKDPYLAIWHNPIGGNYDEGTMQLWEARGRIVVDDGMKVGCKSITTIKQIEKPILTTEQRVEIAIRCAIEVYKEPWFIKWANGWIDNVDRSGVAAARIATRAARAARAAAAAEAAEAARTAAAAARAAWAARAAEAAARAAWAARAARAATKLDIIKIIHEVIKK